MNYSGGQVVQLGHRVLLISEPATVRVDDYGRLLRYVIRASVGVNVNLRLVRRVCAFAGL
jgi:hypothetical protein